MTIRDDTIVYPLPSEELVKKREEGWNQRLPRDYRDFLMKYNGARPNEMSFECNDRDYALIRFLCILEDYNSTDDGWYDIDVVESELCDRLSADEDCIGSDVLPIGELFAGDFLCLDFTESAEKPTVCVWSHEESGPFEPTTYKVADSFSEFLDLLF